MSDGKENVLKNLLRRTVGLPTGSTNCCGPAPVKEIVLQDPAAAAAAEVIKQAVPEDGSHA